MEILFSYLALQSPLFFDILFNVVVTFLQSSVLYKRRKCRSHGLRNNVKIGQGVAFCAYYTTFRCEGGKKWSDILEFSSYGTPGNR